MPYKDKATALKYYQKNRARISARALKWNREHPERAQKSLDACRRKNAIRYWADRSILSHRKRGYIVKIGTAELVAIAKNNPTCYYCGHILDFLPGRGQGYTYSPTVDRRDNGPDVSAENINIVCHGCNVAKWRRTHLEFIEYCKKIAMKWGTN